MSNITNFDFDYYYGIETQQFSFYQIPRLLIKDKRFKGLSTDAKLLYGLMLDRMSLSMKNGWLDDKNRAYIIYTIENIMEDLECGKDKAVKILAEIDSKKGIGLIERIRRGLGKPDIIYVKNFATINIKNWERKALNADVSKEVGKSDFRDSDFPTSEILEIRPQDVGFSDPNYTNINYTNKSYTDHTIHTNQSDTLTTIDTTSAVPDFQNKNDMTDNMDDMVVDMVADENNAYMTLIRDNIEYDLIYDSYKASAEKELLEGIYEIICDVVCIKRKTIRIGKEDYPYELVKSRFLKLKSNHVKYVIDYITNITTEITNIRSYLVTVLYNAPSTIIHYQQQQRQHNNNNNNYINSTKQNTKPKTKNSFNDFPQNNYDFDQLEKELLGGFA